MSRLAALAGIDAGQWLALTRTYLLMDFRRGGGARRTASGSTHGSPVPAAAMVAGAFVNSLMISLLVYLIRDPLTAAVVMVSMGGATTSMLLMVDFAGSVLAAEDYWVLAPRPVSSRTYFAARLAAVLAYITAFSLVMSLAPALVFLLAHGMGFGGFTGAIAATVLSSVAGAGLVIAAYTSLVTRVSASRLVPVISLVHLCGSMMAMTGFMLVMRGLDDPNFRDVSISDLYWFWYLPAAWFAALVPTLAGTGGAAELAAAAGALASTVVLLSLACGRISLDSAARLTEASSRGAALPARRALDRIPGFRNGEGYVVATLIRAQFRHDLRFRLAILGVLPMTVFYMFLGWEEGLLSDPFSSRDTGAAPLYMALGFLPMMLHGALQTSDSWKACWLFWATPADPARLVVASKNFVAVFFLGTYLLALAAIWACFYDRIWHAFVHAAFLGAGAHMLLQWAVMFSPQLPFAREPKRAENSGRLFWLFLVGAMCASLAPMMLPSVYARPRLAVALAALLMAATIALEWMLRRRAREHFSGMEFT
jgi:hypothetical protein